MSANKTASRKAATATGRKADPTSRKVRTINAASDGGLLARFEPNFLSTAESDSLLEYLRSAQFRRIPYRRKVLKRGDKVIWRRDARVKPYRWGQQVIAYQKPYVTLGFPPQIARIAQRMNPRINHVIAIRYSSGVDHHIP